MPKTTLDARGRLTIPPEIRERYGERYQIVQLHSGTKLLPIDDDPLEALRSASGDVETTSEELRQEARNEALDEDGR